LTLDATQDLRTAQALHAALVEAENFLDIPLDWEFVKENVAELDWVTGAALAKETSWDVPTASLLAKLLSQGAAQARQNQNVIRLGGRAVFH